MGRVTVEISGGGYGEATLLPVPEPGDIDPIDFELGLLAFHDTNPAATTVTFTVENPSGLENGDVFDFGALTAAEGLFQLNLSSIPVTTGTIAFEGALSELLVDSVADGAQIRVGGKDDQELKIVADGQLGSKLGVGVDLIASGKVEVTAAAWNGGTWSANSLGSVQITGGDLSASIGLEAGFESIEVSGGDLDSATIMTGHAVASSTAETAFTWQVT